MIHKAPGLAAAAVALGLLVDGDVVVGSVAYVVTRFVDFKLPLLP